MLMITFSYNMIVRNIVYNLLKTGIALTLTVTLV